MEEKTDAVSLRTAVTIVAGVLIALVIAGVTIGEMYFWKPADARTIAQKQFDNVEKAFKKNPKSVPAALTYAIALYTSDEKNNAAAEKVFKDLLAKSPKDLTIMFNYGLFKKNTGDFKTAQEYFEKVLKKSPYYTPANVQYAIMLRDKGDFEVALQKLDNALRIEPGAADIHLEKAKVYIAMKDKEKALSSLKKALEFVPEYDEANKLLKELEQGGK